MAKSKAKDKGTEKLVKNGQEVKPSLDPAEMASPILTNRKKPEAHIRPHTVKGRIYYYYCQPGQKEKYLGDADFILEAVREKRRKRCSKS